MLFTSKDEEEEGVERRITHSIACLAHALLVHVAVALTIFVFVVFAFQLIVTLTRSLSRFDSIEVDVYV